MQENFPTFIKTVSWFKSLNFFKLAKILILLAAVFFIAETTAKKFYNYSYGVFFNGREPVPQYFEPQYFQLNKGWSTIVDKEVQGGGLCLFKSTGWSRGYPFSYLRFWSRGCPPEIFMQLNYLTLAINLALSVVAVYVVSKLLRFKRKAIIFSIIILLLLVAKLSFDYQFRFPFYL